MAAEYRNLESASAGCPVHRLPYSATALPQKVCSLASRPSKFPKQQSPSQHHELRLYHPLSEAMADVEDQVATAPVAVQEDQQDQEMALTTTNTEVAAPVEKRVKKIIRKKKLRPARPQVDPDFITSEPPPQTGTIFNIWYNKWSGGDREDKYLSKTHAKGRCNVAKDTGFTKADRIPGSFFCLFFARGICPKGQDCEYLHRLPGTYDIYNPNVDCFGRDKHSDYRDDMGGVGSFLRQNRTVYAGRIHVTDDIEEIVARHFAEWGQVERSKYLLTNSFLSGRC